MSVGPVVGTAWLAEHLGHAPLRVVDCRWYLNDPAGGRAAYDEGHIPGAIFMSLEDDLTAPAGPGRHPLPTRESFAATIGAAGIGNRSIVVAYDDRTGGVASRFWWMMRWVGHRNVAVLDGGLEAWKAADGPTTALLPDHDATGYEIGADTMPTIDRSELSSRIGGLMLVDARARPRFRGDIEPIDPIAGHIPSAVNAPHEENLGPDGTLAGPADLLSRFAGLGVSNERETVVYCGSGVTACQDILAMEVAGLPTATLYPGSWSDWSSSPDAGVATGD